MILIIEKYNNRDMSNNNSIDKQEKQAQKARLCAMGENLVITQLLQKGWDAFNANFSLNNYKSIDIVCINNRIPESTEHWWKPKTSFVQVKTSVENNITTGFSMKQALDKDYLWKMVKGPYVFVSAIKDKITNQFSFRYFIIPRSVFVKLLYISNVFYINVIHKNENMVLSAPACISISWLEGGQEFSPMHKTHFDNPLDISCENEWRNIWED